MQVTFEVILMSLFALVVLALWWLWSGPDA